MPQLSAKQPIGMFDSGIGGLTVAKALVTLLPKEDLIYFGDTAHLPYGEKSREAIQAYAVKIARFLLDHEVKALIIACNSASAAAFELVQAYVGQNCQVFNVIDPVVDYVAHTYPTGKVGLIGTRQTINSQVYASKIAASAPNLELKALATPLLASMIEEGFASHALSREMINAYLGNHELDGIEALILGCTHYPLIRQAFADYYPDPIGIIDGAELTSLQVKAWLQSQQLLNDAGGSRQFYVSDYTDSFAHSTSIFFGKEVKLLEHCLWE